MNPEVIFLKPLHGETKRETAWQCLMVEFGIYFAFDDQYQLPDGLPGDLSGVKVVCVDPRSWDEYQGSEIGLRLRQFADSGGIVFKLGGPEQFDAIDENAIRGDLEMLMASADLTLAHPALRTRLQARTFSDLGAALFDPYFSGQIETGFTKGPEALFNEPFAYMVLQTLEQLAELDPTAGWTDRLHHVLDRMLEIDGLTFGTLDQTTAMDVFVRAGLATGDRRHVEFAAAAVRRVVETYPRIAGIPVLEPGRDHILWNESLGHLMPACVAVGAATGAEELIDLAVHAARTLHGLNADPQSGLWYHWGAPGGRRGPALWARGQGWALTGLVGILRHLPADHPARSEMMAYLDEVAAGLCRTQTAEGLWRNVLDDADTRVCVRASAMFVYLLAEAQRCGWVAADRVDTLLHRGWTGVRGRVWRDKLCTVCCGTGAGATYQHYASRPVLFYGAAAALRAGASYVLTYGTDVEL